MVELRVDGGAPSAAIGGIIQVFRGSATINGLVKTSLCVSNVAARVC